MKKNQSKSIGGDRGGRRAGAGCKKGVPNKRTAAVFAAVKAGGITPLDYMLELLRQPIPNDAEIPVKISMQAMRFEAAKAAAPYVHPKLAAVEHTGKDGGPIESNVTYTAEEAYKRMLAAG